MEGLLHLSAVAIVLTAGYLGVDKARHNTDALKNALTRAKEIAGELVNELGLSTINQKDKKRRPSWKSLSTVYPAWVICTAAEVDMVLGWHRCPHFFYRQKYIPCYRYFSKRKDIRLVTWMFAVSTLIFLMLVFNSIWEIWFLQTLLEKGLLFITLTVVLLIVFALGAVSFRLMNLDAQFDKLKAKVQKRLNKQREDAVKLLEDTVL